MTNVGQARPLPDSRSAAAAAPGLAWTGRLFGLIAVALALLSALATFLVLADLTPICTDPRASCSRMLIGDGVTALFLLVVIGWEVGASSRRAGAAARPHGCTSGSSRCFR